MIFSECIFANNIVKYIKIFHVFSFIYYKSIIFPYKAACREHLTVRNKPKMAYSCDLPKFARQQCTFVDGANIAPGREVIEDTSRYGSASSCKVKFTTAHIFEGHTKNFSFLGCLDNEIMQFS